MLVSLFSADPCKPCELCAFARGQPYVQKLAVIKTAPCAFKPVVGFRLIQDTWPMSKILLYLEGRSSPPIAFPVGLHFPVLLISSSGSGRAMAWLLVHSWGLFRPEEMKEKSGAQELQEHPAACTSLLSATFSPDSGHFWELKKKRISDTWHIKPYKEKLLKSRHFYIQLSLITMINLYYPVSESNKRVFVNWNNY